MRLRQIALVARERDPVVEDLCAVLSIEVGFHDPGVKFFGLHNAVIPVGDTFLEVVSPVEKNTTAGRYLARKGGDCGYMLLLQTDDFEEDRRRLDALSVRVVWSADLDDIRGMHLHPRDTGGTLCSIDQPTPPESWRWAGSEWRSKVRTDVAQQIASAVLQSPDPEKLAFRYAQVFGGEVRNVGGAFEIALAQGTLRFEAAMDERGECLAAFGVHCADSERALDTARSRGLDVAEAAVQICGTWIRLCEPLC
ncbi:MAG: VOC family protein [Myxococcota bacterium]